MVKMDAPQLENFNAIVSNDGRSCQLTLTNRAGEQLSFQLSYRQLFSLIEPLRQTAVEMRKRLLANNQAGAAEMLDSFVQAGMVTNLMITPEVDSGDPILWVEIAEMISVAMRFPTDLAQKLVTLLTIPSAQQSSH